MSTEQVGKLNILDESINPHNLNANINCMHRVSNPCLTSSWIAPTSVSNAVPRFPCPQTLRTFTSRPFYRKLEEMRRLSYEPRLTCVDRLKAYLNTKKLENDDTAKELPRLLGEHDSSASNVVKMEGSTVVTTPFRNNELFPLKSSMECTPGIQQSRSRSTTTSQIPERSDTGKEGPCEKSSLSLNADANVRQCAARGTGTPSAGQFPDLKDDSTQSEVPSLQVLLDLNVYPQMRLPLHMPKDTWNPNVVGLDCEMVGVGVDGKRSMVARVSLVNYNGVCIYDKYIKPECTITDYRTPYSGITKSNLVGAEDLVHVRAEVEGIIGNKILVGHGLQNDLKVLRLEHPNKLRRDTSTFRLFTDIFHGKTPSLKNLATLFLRLSIQKAEHSSIEDASVAVHLYKLFEEEWEGDLHKP